MAWQVVGEGASLSDLDAIVGDMELSKGTRVRVVMDLKVPIGWAFDVWGAELIFNPFVPDGMEMVDVYGEGSQGIIEMEADPVWLVAMLTFIRTHWIAITIAGFVLAAVILFIRVAVEVPTMIAFPFLIAAGVVAAVIGVTVVSRYLKGEKEGGEI